jgi:hypothetical protein
MTPSHLATALRAHAQGVYCLEAAAELLVAQSWLRRPDFSGKYLNVTPGLVDGQPMATVTALSDSLTIRSRPGRQP